MKRPEHAPSRLRLVLAAAVVAAGGLWAGASLAQSDGDGATPGQPRNSMPFEQWLADLKAEARADGIGDATLSNALADVAPINRVIELDRRQPEFTRTFWAYMNNRVTEGRVAHGRKMLQKHGALLDRVARAHGVPKRYLVAFWGMETDFGRHLGSFPVIDSLATLAYDQRRAAFFRTELLHALRIVDAGHIAAEDMTGSWAGAMGHMQFLPTTFVRHAVDASGDGRKDIWGTLHDAFASGANYLGNLGWKEDERWGREVRLPDDFNWRLATLNERKSVGAWADLGVRRANGAPLPRADIQGSIVLPQGHEGPAFLVYDNFRAILSWNRSINYAVAVGHLADRLIGLPKLQTGRAAAGEAPLSREQAMRLQERLNKLGFDAGEVDGLPGSNTRAAIRRFQSAAGLPADGHPEPSLLDQLETYARARESG